MPRDRIEEHRSPDGVRRPVMIEQRGDVVLVSDPTPLLVRPLVDTAEPTLRLPPIGQTGQMPPDPSTATSSRQIRLGHVLGAVLVGVGMIEIAIGLFVPWLASGSRERNSLELMSLLQRFPFSSAWWYRALPVIWPGWGPAAVLVAAFLLVRRRRIAAVLGAVVGILALGVGATILIVGGGMTAAGVHLVTTGPLSFVTAGVLACSGAMLLLSPGGSTVLTLVRPSLVLTESDDAIH